MYIIICTFAYLHICTSFRIFNNDMTRPERYRLVLEYFSNHMPTAETELHYNNPYELLVAVILSAQCTDKRVNLTTPALFQRFPNALELSKASVEEVFDL